MLIQYSNGPVCEQSSLNFEALKLCSSMAALFPGSSQLGTRVAMWQLNCNEYKPAALNFINSVSILGSCTDLNAFLNYRCVLSAHAQGLLKGMPKPLQSRHPLHSRSAGRHSALYASPISSGHQLHKSRPVSRQLFPSLAMKAAQNGGLISFFFTCGLRLALLMNVRPAQTSSVVNLLPLDMFLKVTTSFWQFFKWSNTKQIVKRRKVVR